MNKLLPKVVEKRKKRLGRGYGSGKGGHTVGRGEKGQKTSNKTRVLFEGMKVKKSLLKRLPFQRGRGKFKAGKKPLVINLEILNILPAGTKVDLETLIKAGIVEEAQARRFGVKILGGGKLDNRLKIELPISKSAARKNA